MLTGTLIKIILIPSSIWEQGASGIVAPARIVTELEDIARRAIKGVANQKLESRRVAQCLERLQDVAANIVTAGLGREFQQPDAAVFFKSKNAYIAASRTPNPESRAVTAKLQQAYCKPADITALQQIYRALHAANQMLGEPTIGTALREAIVTTSGMVEVFDSVGS